MIAATIFFNICFTARTYFCVFCDPLKRFRITAVLPLLESYASDWFVPKIGTFETIFMSTFTCTKIFGIGNYFLCCISAANWRWAPTNRLIVLRMTKMPFNQTFIPFYKYLKFYKNLNAILPGWNCLSLPYDISQGLLDFGWSSKCFHHQQELHNSVEDRQSLDSNHHRQSLSLCSYPSTIYKIYDHNQGCTDPVYFWSQN